MNRPVPVSAKKDERIGVLLSGGVDSSVATHLLLREGYSVYGIFITILSPAHIPCTTFVDRQDAMRACAAFSVPFLEFDATDLYRKQVIEPFVDAYRQGNTPNPDILCNQFVKFDAVRAFALEQGCTRIATGHYAQVKQCDGVRRLYRSVDADKDQTYFIYTLSQEILDSVLFPVGGYTKRQVRGIAASARLPAATKQDSVGLCFLGDVLMKSFLLAYIGQRTGAVVLLDSGRKIGTHDGVWFYTLGQRRGFVVSGVCPGPYVVVKKDTTNNVLFVRHADADVTAGLETQVTLVDTVFRRMPDSGERVVARYRHRGELFPVSVRDEGGVRVSFDSPQHIAPGQSVVVYGHDGECLGGGVAA